LTCPQRTGSPGRGRPPPGQHGLTILERALGRSGERRRIDPELLEQCPVTQNERVPFDRARETAARVGMEIGHGASASPFASAARAPPRRAGARSRVPDSRRGAALHSTIARGLVDSHEARPPLVSVPVLSTTRVSTRARVSRAAASFKRTPPCAAADADHDRHRCGEAESAGQATIRTTRPRPAHGRSAARPRAPGDEGDHGHDDDGGHEPGRHAVGETLERRATALRLGHEPHDLSKKRVTATSRRASGSCRCR